MRLRDLKQWVCWRFEERGGKPTKVPYSPGGASSRARSDDPRTWGTYVEARRAERANGYDGIGFVFTEGDPFCGVDLDECLDPETSEIEPWAAEVLDQLDSYAEFSPSGKGLHVIVRAELPEGRPGNRKGRVEIYDRGRFFTVTGRHLPVTPRQVEDRQEQLAVLHARLFPGENGWTSNGTPTPAEGGNGLADAEILRRAMGATNGERFPRLWAGDRSGYASDSEADLALCSILAFWIGPDKERIAALFARSGLNRKKWDREDYRKRTIARALAAKPATEFYSPSENGAGNLREERVLATEAPTWSLATLTEAAEFPVEAMPAPCRPLIEEAGKALGCAPELLALPMLAVLSSAIGTSRVVEIKGGWREWAALFVAVVASPGAMKTPAAKLAKKPAFERQRRLGRSYAEEKEDWKREVRQWEIEKREAAKAAEPAPEEPEAPLMGRCVAGDTTVEALVGILEDNLRGLLVHRDELAGWVRSMDQYKGGKGSDRQNWLNLWNTDEIVVDRKSRMGEPLIVARPFVSLFGGIQPAMLGELGGAGSLEDGLMDRFLFAYPKPRHVRFTYEEVSEEAEARYAALYDGLADLRLAIDEHGDPNPKPLKLSPEARRLFAYTVDASGAETLQPGFPSRLEGVWSKLRGYLARLSLVLAVCRYAEGPAQAPPGVKDAAREERVEREDVESAAMLLVYFKAHARRVYAELSAPDPSDLLASELRDLLEGSGGRWEGSATDLHRELAEREAVGLPDRPEDLSKLVLRIGERSTALEVAQGWRKSGGREGKSRRVLKLALKNAVVPVVTVDPAPGSTLSDNSNNGSLDALAPRGAPGDNGDYGNNGDQSRERGEAEATAAEPRGPGDGRSRFTI